MPAERVQSNRREGELVPAGPGPFRGCRAQGLPGDRVLVDVREGSRPNLEAVAGLVTDYSGMAAYMEIDQLRRLLGERGTSSGAYLKVDDSRMDEFWRSVKGAPAIASVCAAASERESFIKTTVEMVGVQKSVYYFFSLVVAFGVIYNGARVALSERARSRATLRVLGFTRREATVILLTELGLLTLFATGPGLLLGTAFKDDPHSANTEVMRLRIFFMQRPMSSPCSTFCSRRLLVRGGACEDRKLMRRR